MSLQIQTCFHSVLLCYVYTCFILFILTLFVIIRVLVEMYVFQNLCTFKDVAVHTYMYIVGGVFEQNRILKHVLKSGK